jgi:bifunctional DNA-binding transcriptional regulator/antitoxin component of YhaV-PrlF toxin-antitoxin module
VVEIATLGVRKRGVVALPARLRRKYGIEEGDVLRLVDLDGILLMAPGLRMEPELARLIERIRNGDRLDVEDLAKLLRAGRDSWNPESEDRGGES